MDKHVYEMKQALQGYRDARTEAENLIKFYAENYGEEAGRREIERQNKLLADLNIKAARTITSAYEAGRTSAEQWAQPDGSQLTADIKLFDVGMVTPEVFETLKLRYKDNATMTAAIKAKGQQLNFEAKRAAKERGEEALSVLDPYNVRDIMTAEDKLKAWDKLKAQALDTLDALDGAGAYAGYEWGASIGKHMSAEIIEHFGEGSGL